MDLIIKKMENTVAQTLKLHPENEVMIKIFAPLLLCEERFILENPINKVSAKTETLPTIDRKNISIDVKKVGALKKALLEVLQDVLPQFKNHILILEKNLSNAKLKAMCRALFLEENTRAEIINEYLDTTFLPSLAKKKESEKLLQDKGVFVSLLELLLSRTHHAFLSRYARAVKAQEEKTKNIKTTKQVEYQENVTNTAPLLPTPTLESHVCPYCGERPSMSIIHSKEGKRDLYCQTCGQTWRFKRTVCPNCFTEDPKNLQMIYQDMDVAIVTQHGVIGQAVGKKTGMNKKIGGTTSGISERAIYCEKCNHYLLELDLREKEVSFEYIGILSLGMAYLDAIMQERDAVSFV